MPVVTMRELLECGVHFGHQTKRWNPKMRKYIFTARNDIHVIDLQKTLKLIEKSYQVVKETVARGGKVLFVGTKKQAQEAILLEATRCDMYYVNQRWLGGTLTNNITIRKSINKLRKLEKMRDENVLENLSKKEASQILKQIDKLNYALAGIKNMIKLPDLLIIIDTNKEQLSIKEAKTLNIPTIGIIDTNADPTEVKYPIPANDDAIRAIKLICSIMANAVLEGRQSLINPKLAEVKADTIEEVLMEEALDTLLLDETAFIAISPEAIEEEKILKTRKKKAVDEVVIEK